jgi:hypothetical protein
MEPEKAEVKVIKFMSGQEIIAKVIGGDGVVYVIESPLAVQPVRQGDSIGVAFAPFSMAGAAEGQITIAGLHVTCMIDPDERLKTHYLASIAGITIPSDSASRSKITL